MTVSVAKSFRISRPLHARLVQTAGIDMAAALHDFTGMSEGTGRSQAQRMKRYGRRAQTKTASKPA